MENIAKLAIKQLGNKIASKVKFLITRKGTYLAFYQEMNFFEYFIFDKAKQQWNHHHSFQGENTILNTLQSQHLLIRKMACSDGSYPTNHPKRTSYIVVINDKPYNISKEQVPFDAKKYLTRKIDTLGLMNFDDIVKTEEIKPAGIKEIKPNLTIETFQKNAKEFSDYLKKMPHRVNNGNPS